MISVYKIKHNETNRQLKKDRHSALDAESHDLEQK